MSLHNFSRNKDQVKGWIDNKQLQLTIKNKLEYFYGLTCEYLDR